LVHSIVWGMLSGCTNNFPESGRGLGHVTPTILAVRSAILATAWLLVEILHSKRTGVTDLTFQGHVTSSVTSPFDSPYAISCWWFFRTKTLSLTVSEIFNVECHTMVDMTFI